MVSFYLPMTKLDLEQKMVWGYASTEDIDADGEIIKREAIEQALPGYLKFGNVREMHQLSAVGVTKEASMDEKGLFIGVKVVDPLAWEKVKEKVYQGFSVGGRATARDPLNKKNITGMELVEISLVDRPANPGATFTVYKAAQHYEPSQFWDCGIPGHDHSLKADATNCVKEQEALFGGKAEAVECRKFIASNIAKLDLNGLVSCATTMAKTAAIDPPLFLKTEHQLEQPTHASADPNEQKTEGGEEATDKKKDPKDEEDPEETENDGDEDDAKKVKGDYGSHDEAGYADDGHQEDKKPRYPLKLAGTYSPGRIRAAWAHVNQNLTNYSSDHVNTIKSNIVAAWKAAIDPDGPPVVKTDQAASTSMESKVANDLLKAFGTPDTQKSLKKGLMAVCSAIALRNELADFGTACKAETMKASAPERLDAVTKNFADLITDLLEQEVSEILTSKAVGDLNAAAFKAEVDPVLTYARKEMSSGSDKQLADVLRDIVKDRTGELGASHLLDLIKDLDPNGTAASGGEAHRTSGTDTSGKDKPLTPNGPEASGGTEGKQTQAWGRFAEGQVANDLWGAHGENAQKVHDLSMEKGAKCAAAKAAAAVASTAEGEDTVQYTKKQLKKKLKKATAPLQEQVEGLTKTVDELTKTLSNGRNPPLPGRQPPLRGVVVDKSQDVDVDHMAKAKDAKDLTPSDILKEIHNNPSFVSGRG